MVDAVVDMVVNANMTTRSGATIRRMGIKIIMEMVFKIWAMFGCAIVVVRSVDGITTIIMDFMPIGSVILALFP